MILGWSRWNRRWCDYGRIIETMSDRLNFTPRLLSASRTVKGTLRSDEFHECFCVFQNVRLSRVQLVNRRPDVSRWSRFYATFFRLFSICRNNKGYRERFLNERFYALRDSNSLLLLLALWNEGRAYLRVYPSVFYANFNSLYIARGLYCIDIAIYGMRDSFVKFETRWEDVHVVNCITSICISRRIVGKK